MVNAVSGIDRLKDSVDTLIVIPNDKLLEIVDRRTTMPDALKKADEVLQQSVQGITDLINVPALINLDFADVQTVMKDKGLAHIGIGEAHGDDKALEAVKLAVASPLLETTINGATHVIINISGDISLVDGNDAASYVQELAGDDANIIFGAKYDESMTDTAKVTVIATGLEAMKKPTLTPLMSGMKYTTGASATATKPMNSGLTSRSGLTGTAGNGYTRSLNGGAGASASTGTNPAFTGIQKPKKPESSVPEKDIQIPTFLKNTRRP
jgi:cell division protein FtsZ